MSIIRKSNWKDCHIEKTKYVPSPGLTEPSFTNSEYDSCAYKSRIKESMGPGMYHLKDRVHYDSCFMDFPGYIGYNSNSGVLSSSIDTDSELRNLNYLASKCPEKRYNPILNCKECKKCNTGIPCGCEHCKIDPHNYYKDTCSPQLIPNYTREKKPCNDVISKGIDRFQPLCMDLQKLKTISSNNIIGSSTRLLMKDITTELRDEAPKPIFDKYCDCEKFIGPHTKIKCMYKKDVDNYNVLPKNF